MARLGGSSAGVSSVSLSQWLLKRPLKATLYTANGRVIRVLHNQIESTQTSQAALGLCSTDLGYGRFCVHTVTLLEHQTAEGTLTSSLPLMVPDQFLHRGITTFLAGLSLALKD